MVKYLDSVEFSHLDFSSVTEGADFVGLGCYLERSGVSLP